MSKTKYGFQKGNLHLVHLNPTKSSTPMLKSATLGIRTGHPQERPITWQRRQCQILHCSLIKALKAQQHTYGSPNPCSKLKATMRDKCKIWVPQTYQQEPSPVKPKCQTYCQLPTTRPPTKSQLQWRPKCKVATTMLVSPMQQTMKWIPKIPSIEP